jgi:hypothetical protein
MDDVYPSDSIFDVNATVTIIGSNGYKSLPAIYQGRGRYLLQAGKFEDDVKYGIEIEYDGETYQSALSKPLVTPEIDSVSWVQPDSVGAVHFRVSTHDNSAAEAKFFLWDYKEDWETTATFFATLFFNPNNDTFYTDFSAPYYYCWRSSVSNNHLIGSTESLKANRIINKQLYEFDPGNNRFSTLYCVTVNQKAISKGAYDYYQNKIQLNEGMGGLFTPQPSEVSGNITCITNPSKKAMGYIEVTKNTTQKRIFVYPYQLTRPRAWTNCELITADSVKNYLMLNGITYAAFYAAGNRPVEVLNPITNEPANWAFLTCTDCVAAGGSKAKPDFWPNDHK